MSQSESSNYPFLEIGEKYKNIINIDIQLKDDKQNIGTLKDYLKLPEEDQAWKMIQLNYFLTRRAHLNSELADVDKIVHHLEKDLEKDLKRRPKTGEKEED